MSTQWSLLVDPIVRVTSGGGAALRLTLPEVLSRLSQAEDLQFTALRPHQEAAWHAFAVQLAYLALEAADAPTLPADPIGWQALLRGLTSSWSNDEPWCLVVDDWAQPAFMQSPGPLAEYSGVLSSAQELDRLVTSRNHDEKIGKLRGADAHDIDTWLFALVSLQGFADYGGRFNYGSMRMNGGDASRPQFRLIFKEGAGAEFLRDLRALQTSAEQLWADAERLQIGVDQPLALLWVEPWADLALPLARVHPLCLEVTRRVRLRLTATGHFKALTAPSTSMRVAAKDNKGIVLDPWIPLRLDGVPRALTAKAETFSYRGLSPLLFDAEYCALPLLARPTAIELASLAPATMLAQVLVGGKGKTDGYLRREVQIPPDVLPRFMDRSGELALRSKLFVELAGIAQGKVLRPALLQFVDGRDEVNWQNRDFDKAVAPWMPVLERRIDEVFFTTLFQTELEPPMSDEQARRHWVQCLRDLVQQVFVAATASLPTRDHSRHVARGRAERRLAHGLQQHLADQAPAEAAGAEPTRKARGARKPAPKSGSMA